jgi:diguanylate cyclase (GGDEF)-like protein/PAS domain S-box-containing protein
MKLPFFQWRSINARVTLFTLVILLVSFWALGFSASRLLREDMQRVLGEQQFSTASIVAHEINERLTDRLQALETIAKELTPTVLANPTAVQTLLQQRPLLQLLFNAGAFATGTDGIAVADVPGSAQRVGVSYLDRDFILTALQQGKSSIGRPVIGKQLKAPIIVLAVPIRDAHGQVIGVLAGGTDLKKSNFLDQIAQSQYGKTGGYLLIAPQHNLIVTASDKSRVMLAVPAPGLNAMHDRYMQGYQGFGLATSSRGVLELSAAQGIPAAGWFIAVTLPAAEAFAPIDRMLERMYFSALFFTAIAMVLIWWLMTRLLQQQFAPLLAASRAISIQAAGDHSAQALPVVRQDEIGELISGFNRLIESSVQREAQLRSGEHRYRSLLENLAAGVVVHGPDTAIMLSNAMAASLLGLTQDQMLGKVAPDPDWCFLNEDGTRMHLEDYPVNRVLASGEPLRGYVAGVQHARGTEPTWVLCSAYLTRDEAGGISQAIVTFTDITERKRAEAALTASQARWKFAIEGAGYGLWDWNIQTGKAFYSSLYKSMLGFSEDEIGDTADEWSKRIHPDDAPGVFAALQPYMDGKAGSAKVEFRMLCKDGHWLWTLGRGMVMERDADGKPVRMIGTNSDITERKLAEDELRLAANVFSHTREGITITDAAGTIVDVNASFTRITGYSRAEAVGQNPRMLSSGRQDKAFYEGLWRALLEQGHWSGEIWNRRKDGEVFAELLTISAVRDAQGHTQHYVALFSDITAIKEHQYKLDRMAHFDALTSLPNRLLLADRLQQGLAQAVRRGQSLAVAYLDLDGFKAINDLHGHDVGDQLLVALATGMKQALREGDTLARLGGDEFVAVLSDLTEAQASIPLLNRLLAAAAHPVAVGNLRVQVSASLGVTFFPQPQDIEADQLLRQADQAMYQAKLAGKNRYHVFDAAQDSNLRGHHESLERIRLALEQREFVLHYQPKVNMRSGKVVGAEALIRWQHPERGLLPPAVFLPVVENDALAIAIGEWVIDAALTQMERWHAAGLTLRVSVNVGARQLQQVDFVERLQVLFAAHPNVPTHQLELEVLETSALEDIHQVSRVIEACNALGVDFALDDFGTGYSSLTYLKRLRVGLLKIDQSFVRDMLDDPDDLAILEGVIGLAAAFKRDVIAEGVETVAHGTLLLQLGCEMAQGYGIARPMPPEQVLDWVAAWQPEAVWLALPWPGGQMSQRHLT